MTEPTPSKLVEIVIGIDQAHGYNFLNYADPANPKRLRLDLSERCELFFRLSDSLIDCGWTFQNRPIKINDDYGVNFSSYVWVTQGLNGRTYEKGTAFKIIYECNRMGIYTYSLFMLDRFEQKIDLDPDVENGAGHLP